MGQLFLPTATATGGGNSVLAQNNVPAAVGVGNTDRLFTIAANALAAADALIVDVCIDGRLFTTINWGIQLIDSVVGTIFDVQVNFNNGAAISNIRGIYTLYVDPSFAAAYGFGYGQATNPGSATAPISNTAIPLLALGINWAVAHNFTLRLTDSSGNGQGTYKWFRARKMVLT